MAAETVEGAGLDEPFDRRPVDRLGIDALAEVEEIPKAAALGADADDLLGRAAANALDGGQTEDDLAVVDGELPIAGIDIRRQHLDAHFACVGNVVHHDVALAAILNLTG